VELWGESNTLLIVGSDTTATSLAATFFYLSQPRNDLSDQNQPLRKLQKEILETFGGPDQVEEIKSGPKLNSCVYLRACVDEAMRMSPPVGGLLPREVLPGNLVIDDYQIPAGTVVGVPTYTIHHNKTYFHNPNIYIPERWILDSSTESQNTPEKLEIAKSAFCPFSIGPRGCIGKTLAYTELLIAVARTVCLYEMRRAEGLESGRGRRRADTGEFQLWDTFTSAKDGPFIEFRRRDSVNGGDIF